MSKNIRLYIDGKFGNKLNSITKYMGCDKKELMEFLIVEAWKSIDIEKKAIKLDDSADEVITFKPVSFVTEGV